jgi:hypothetical protein
MKKLQLLMMTMLSTAIVQASTGGLENESIDNKIARQKMRTSKEKGDHLASKGNIRKETPEFRLIIKALEYRASQVEGKITEDHFLKVMKNKEQTYHENLKHNNIEFGNEQQAFLEFCKTASLSEIASRLEEMKDSAEQFMDQRS